MNMEERYAHAQQMLSNPIWDEAFATITKAYTVKLMQLGQKEDLERYRLCEAIRQTEFVKRHIEQVFEEGQAGALNLEEESKVTQFIRRF